MALFQPNVRNVSVLTERNEMTECWALSFHMKMKLCRKAFTNKDQLVSLTNVNERWKRNESET